MALDHAMLEMVQPGRPPALRLYRWSAPTISFGRNQVVRGLYDLDAARAAGIGFVRRPTGGLAVLHADELTYCVCAPVGAFGSPRESFHAIHHMLARALGDVGVAATVAPPARSPDPADARTPCFQAPLGGEVVVGGKKLVGSAQRCERRLILQHGSILLGGDQSPVRTLQREAPAATEPNGWTSLEALGARPPLDGLVAAVGAAAEAELGIVPGGASPDEEVVARLEARYADDAWTWRR